MYFGNLQFHPKGRANRKIILFFQTAQNNTTEIQLVDNMNFMLSNFEKNVN